MYGVEKEMPTIWPSDQMGFRVFAMAEDSETPFVILRFYDFNGNLEFERYMEDCFSEEMVVMINKALSQLPSSK
jgi:hypothetical protein